MGTLVFMDGTTMPLESVVAGASALGTLYLRVAARMADLEAFENENKTQTMKCVLDGESKTYRGYTQLMDIVPEGSVMRVGMRKSYV